MSRPDKLTSVHTRRVLELLREKLKAAGRGRMTEIQRVLGLHQTYFSEKRRQSLDVGVVLAVLQHLEIEPPAFFRELLERSGEARDAATAEAPPPVPAGAEPIAECYGIDVKAK